MACDAERVKGSVVGLLLAAGAGRRMGQPKALVNDTHGVPWVLGTTRRLLDAGCDRVRVVLGAEAEVAAGLLEPVRATVDVVVAADWATGMAASLRAGLVDLEQAAPTATAALVHLVDLPDVGVNVLRRVLESASAGCGDALARAAYSGVPGHPVLIGRSHWAGVADSASGDRGARDYLAARHVDLVECGDLATGNDVDRSPGGAPTSRAARGDG